VQTIFLGFSGINIYNRNKGNAFSGREISNASRAISWAMLINITINPMFTGLIKNELFHKFYLLMKNIIVTHISISPYSLFLKTYMQKI